MAGTLPIVPLAGLDCRALSVHFVSAVFDTGVIVLLHDFPIRPRDSW